MTGGWRTYAKIAGAVVVVAGMVVHIATGSGAWIIAIGLAALLAGSLRLG